MCHLYYSLKHPLTKDTEESKLCYIVEHVGQRLWSLHQDKGSLWIPGCFCTLGNVHLCSTVACGSTPLRFYSGISCSKPVLWLDLHSVWDFIAFRKPFSGLLIWEILKVALSLDNENVFISMGRNFQVWRNYIKIKVWTQQMAPTPKSLVMPGGGFLWVLRFKVSLQSRFQVSLLYIVKATSKINQPTNQTKKQTKKQKPKNYHDYSHKPLKPQCSFHLTFRKVLHPLHIFRVLPVCASLSSDNFYCSNSHSLFWFRIHWLPYCRHSRW